MGSHEPMHIFFGGGGGYAMDEGECSSPGEGRQGQDAEQELEAIEA